MSKTNPPSVLTVPVDSSLRMHSLPYHIVHLPALQFLNLVDDGGSRNLQISEFRNHETETFNAELLLQDTGQDRTINDLNYQASASNNQMLTKLRSLPLIIASCSLGIGVKLSRHHSFCCALNKQQPAWR